MTYVNGPQTVTSGLTLYLDAGNARSYPGSGTNWNSLINNATGSLINGPAFSSVNGGYISFDGTNDYCTLPTNIIQSGNELSFCVWNYGISVSRSIIWFENASAVRVLNVHLPWADGTIYFDAGGAPGDSYDRISKSAGTEYQGWNYWVFTKNATTGTMKIYRNGVEWHSGTGLTRTIGTPSGLGYIGFLPAGSLYHNGYIANMSIYNRELSVKEILQNFNALRGRFGI